MSVKICWQKNRCPKPPPPRTCTTTKALTKQLTTTQYYDIIIIICILPDVRITGGAVRYTLVVVTAAAALTPAIIVAAAHPLEPAVAYVYNNTRTYYIQSARPAGPWERGAMLSS